MSAFAIPVPLIRRIPPYVRSAAIEHERVLAVRDLMDLDPNMAVVAWASGHEIGHPSALGEVAIAKEIDGLERYIVSDAIGGTNSPWKMGPMRISSRCFERLVALDWVDFVGYPKGKLKAAAVEEYGVFCARCGVWCPDAVKVEGFRCYPCRSRGW